MNWNIRFDDPHVGGSAPVLTDDHGMYIRLGVTLVTDSMRGEDLGGYVLRAMSCVPNGGIFPDEPPEGDPPDGADTATTDEFGHAQFEHVHRSHFGQCGLAVWATTPVVMRRTSIYEGVFSERIEPRPIDSKVKAEEPLRGARGVHSGRALTDASSAVIHPLVRPVCWDIERFGRDFTRSGFEQYNRPLGLRIDKVEIDFLDDTSQAAWVSRDNITPKPRLVTESLIPKKYRLIFKSNLNPNEVVEYTCAAGVWNPLGVNELFPTVASNDIPAYIKAIAGP